MIWGLCFPVSFHCQKDLFTIVKLLFPYPVRLTFPTVLRETATASALTQAQPLPRREGVQELARNAGTGEGKDPGYSQLF